MNRHRLVLRRGGVIGPACGRRGRFDAVFDGDPAAAIETKIGTAGAYTAISPGP